MSFRSVAGFTAAVLVGSFSDPNPATGQSKTASISGRVVSSGGDPIAGARVFLLNLRKVQATDSVGRFRFAELRPGSYRLEASLIGFPPLSALVVVNAGDQKDIEFRTDSLGQLLPTIFVEGEPQPDLIRVPTTFERRMAVGHGRFITRAEIERRNPHKIMDMLRFLPGVRSDCRGFVCQLRLNHDTRGCAPAIFVDDQQTHITVLDNTPPSAIEGVEVYRGPSETPPELNNEAARCGGAIAIWTRRGQRHER
jgi:hypothetical protein